MRRFKDFVYRVVSQWHCDHNMPPVGGGECRFCGKAMRQKKGKQTSMAKDIAAQIQAGNRPDW